MHAGASCDDNKDDGVGRELRYYLYVNLGSRPAPHAINLNPGYSNIIDAHGTPTQESAAQESPSQDITTSTKKMIERSGVVADEESGDDSNDSNDDSNDESNNDSGSEYD